VKAKTFSVSVEAAKRNKSFAGEYDFHDLMCTLLFEQTGVFISVEVYPPYMTPGKE